MLLQVCAEVKDGLPEPEAAGVEVVLHGWRLIPFQQRTSVSIPQPGLHHQVTGLGIGDEESHGGFKGARALLPAELVPVISRAKTHP